MKRKETFQDDEKQENPKSITAKNLGKLLFVCLFLIANCKMEQ